MSFVLPEGAKLKYFDEKKRLVAIIHSFDEQKGKLMYAACIYRPDDKSPKLSKTKIKKCIRETALQRFEYFPIKLVYDKQIPHLNPWNIPNKSDMSSHIRYVLMHTFGVRHSKADGLSSKHIELLRRGFLWNEFD